MSEPKQPKEFSGKKFLLFVMLPLLLLFMALFILFAPDEPLGGESTFYPREDPFAARQERIRKPGEPTQQTSDEATQNEATEETAEPPLPVEP